MACVQPACLWANRSSPLGRYHTLLDFHSYLFCSISPNPLPEDITLQNV